MSVNAAHESAKTSGGWSAPSRALRLEKPRQTAASGDGFRSDRENRERRGPKPTRRGAYHFDTAGVSPWNGPVLGAAYAAQVIAQATSAPPGNSARAAYTSPLSQFRPALLLDESV